MVFALLAGIGIGAVSAESSRSWVLTNPTGRDYSNELVRLKIEIPRDFASAQWRVLQEGQEVPFQSESVGTGAWVWVAANLARAQKHSYVLERAAPKAFQPRVIVRREGDTLVMDNGLTAVRVPAAMKGDALQAPVLAVRLPGGKWVGQGYWHTDSKLKSFEAKVVGDGMLFGKVLLDYRFEGVAGVEAVPAFCRVEVTLPVDRRHAVVEEAYEMPRGSYWEFAAANGWSPQRALTIPHSGGFDRKDQLDKDGKPYPFPPKSLRTGQTRMGDTLLALIPRWSQAYDDGWFFATNDGENGVGALVCRAGKWLWPHDSKIEIKVKDSADYAGFRCPTWRGGRYWFLLAGPSKTWADKTACEEYVIRHSFETLDKIHQEYILDWPGLQAPLDKNGKPTVSVEEYCSGAGRFGRRSRAFFGWGPAQGTIGGDNHPIVALIRAQVYFDPDTFGDYWRHFSPENPNFASSWISAGFEALEQASTYPGVTNNPSFKALCRVAEMKAREEVYHSATLPSGAGQECFGYMSRGSWFQHDKICREVGFDPGTRPWQEAAARFIFRASHPLADGERQSHPGGDTHPPGPDVYESLGRFGLKEDLTALKTEEMAGFGMIFRNRPGTPQETYLAFKSGPNRGHFHGDQLSFHYCANGRPLAVDHHSSYAPRAGQEHMHNRVAFHTDKLPWANMDGYERLIAFKTSDTVDVAMGQVESDRLRAAEEFPPEKWDTRLPQEVFDTPLKYRRTIVFLKQAGQDCFVIRDQYAGPDVYATYCLHVLGDRCEQKNNVFDFDGLQALVVKPTEFSVAHHDWEHEYGGKETTKGLRVTVKGRENEFITVLMPKPVKRADVASLVLKKVVEAKVSKGKGVAAEVVDLDLSVRMALQDGKPVVPQVYVTGVSHQKDSFYLLGRAEGGNDNTIRLSIEGVRGRFEKDRIKLDCTLGLARKDDTYSGSYTGTVWDVAAMKAKDKGGEASGKARGGVVSGKLEQNIVPPVPLFDAAWKSPVVQACPGGVKVGDTEVRFGGGLDDVDATAYVTVTQGAGSVFSLTGKDIDMDRSQGEIGLFVPDAGYPFGTIPDWLIRQRCAKPDWYREVWPPTGM